MKSKASLASTIAAMCVLFFVGTAFSGPVNSPQDQGTSQKQSVQTDKNQKVEPGAGKEVGKGTAEGAGNLATLHPGKAAANLGKGAGGAGKDVGVGTGKGVAKIGKGTAKGIGKLGKKMVGKGGKNKNEDTNRAQD
jgi:hypothetical protein